MNLIFCIDKKNGMLFNKRRQSQDRVVREKILALSANAKLWMSQYSAKQFTELSADNLIVDDAYMTKAGVEDYCFVEDNDFSLDGCETIILYHWNRQYPADKYFAVDLKANGYSLVSQTDFAGYSHETITEEIYVKG